MISFYQGIIAINLSSHKKKNPTVAIWKSQKSKPTIIQARIYWCWKKNKCLCNFLGFCFVIYAYKKSTEFIEIRTIMSLFSKTLIFPKW